MCERFAMIFLRVAIVMAPWSLASLDDACFRCNDAVFCLQLYITGPVCWDHGHDRYMCAIMIDFDSCHYLQRIIKLI